MVKRTLIAIAVAALLATTVQAADLADMSVKVDDSWPGQWVWDKLDICDIPVFMDVGMYAQVKDCHKEKIILKQVPCGDIGKGGGDFPCYQDTEDISVRANFNAIIGIDKAEVGDVLKDWSAGIDGGGAIAGDGGWKTLTIRVKAWKTQIWNNSPGNEVRVGTLTVTVKPQ